MPRGHCEANKPCFIATVWVKRNERALRMAVAKSPTHQRRAHEVWVWVVACSGRITRHSYIDPAPRAGRMQGDDVAPVKRRSRQVSIRRRCPAAWFNGRRLQESDP